MVSYIKDYLAKNLGNPTGFGAFLVENLGFKGNVPLILKTVPLTGIQPDHNVLELGFGPGYGLQEAVKCVKDGTGKVYGLDISESMVKSASSKLKTEIEAGKVVVQIGDVQSMPYDSDMFDRVFHTNCYYFWKDQLKCASELLRVMKPGALMVTGIEEARVKSAHENGWLKYGQPDVATYMENLVKAGFCDVKKEDTEVKVKDRNEVFTAIYASAPA